MPAYPSTKDSHAEPALRFTGVRINPGRLIGGDFLIDYRHEPAALAALRAAIEQSMPLFEETDYPEPAILAARAGTVDGALKALGFGISHQLYAGLEIRSLPAGSETGLQDFVLPILAAAGYLVSGTLIIEAWPPYPGDQTGQIEHDSSFLRYTVENRKVTLEVGHILFDQEPIEVVSP